MNDLDRACARAAHFGNYTLDALRSILERRLFELPLDERLAQWQALLAATAREPRLALRLEALRPGLNLEPFGAASGSALKVPLADLPDSKENIRSALNRATRQRGIEVATSSDAEYLYVWKVESES